MTTRVYKCIAGALLAVAVLLHIVAVSTGLYEYQIDQGFVWFDNVLHAMVGVAFGLFAVSVYPNVLQKKLTLAVVLFSAVLLLAMGWEIAEFIFYKIFSTYALGLKVYPTSPMESVWDIASDLIGALVLYSVLALRKQE